MSRPSIQIEPRMIRELSMRSFIRLRQRSKVVLPQPDGPMKAVTARGGNLQVDLVQNLMMPVSEIKIADVNHRVPTDPGIGRGEVDWIGGRCESRFGISITLP